MKLSLSLKKVGARAREYPWIAYAYIAFIITLWVYILTL